MRMARHWTLLAGAAVASISSSGNAVANPSSRQDFHLPAQPLAESLFAIGKATDTEILFLSGDVDGLTAAALNGTYSAEDAVRTVTAPTPLHVEIKDGSIFIRRRSTASATEQPQTEDIVVTGSRIRGGPIASPVVELSQAEIERSGKTNIGDAVRTLPQNFSGGQNPGVAGGGDQGGTNSNFGSASTINLRGLGADATLTLINGHRVAYDSYVQGVDVDTIPLAALDRIEVVPDGASALYGSDAVGGVANIILKKDYDGLSTSARYGGATDGGDHQTELSAVTGTKWFQGGVIATFDFTRVTPITAADRSYTQSLSSDQTLVPGKSQYSGVISGHQALGAVTFSIDGLFNRRSSSVVTAYLPPADYLVSGSRNPFTETSWSISPRASVAIGPSWSSYLTGTYGRDDSDVATRYYTSGVETLNGNVHGSRGA